MSKLRAFGAFWYDFVIGDDWLVAVGVVVGLAVTYGLDQAGVTAWWVLPLLLVIIPAIAVFGIGLTALLRRTNEAPPGGGVADLPAPAGMSRTEGLG